ncbi:MAG: hypothetical protein HYY56_06080 [Candidatus Omnitrophica bacterium]|nr:hypothetical protein [Candidatus Omnitrophota bacterium]MBI3009061.1 hypothetical protein [Candidatus Omnitrophota bacterium]
MPAWFLVLTLITIGFILFIIELFTPTFGIVGITGIVLLIAGCYIAVTQLSMLSGIFVSAASLIIVIACIRIFPRTRIAKRIFLSTSETKDTGFHSGSKELDMLIGKEGVAITTLRPSGTALIDGKRIDVVTDGVYLPQDSVIKVTAVKGPRVVVTEVKR